MFKFDWAKQSMSDEEGMLNQLAASMDEAAKRSNELYEDDGIDDKDYNYITIVVDGIAHRFLLGGPQLAGLSMFIDTVCAENGHATPWEEQEALKPALNKVPFSIGELSLIRDSLLGQLSADAYDECKEDRERLAFDINVLLENCLEEATLVSDM